MRRDGAPFLAGDGRITSKVGERWSARKVLRRTLWQEQDHARQIAGFGWGCPEVRAPEG